MRLSSWRAGHVVYVALFQLYWWIKTIRERIGNVPSACLSVQDAIFAEAWLSSATVFSLADKMQAYAKALEGDDDKTREA